MNKVLGWSQFYEQRADDRRAAEVYDSARDDSLTGKLMVRNDDIISRQFWEAAQNKFTASTMDDNQNNSNQNP
jgi:hypothetical protein